MKTCTCPRQATRHGFIVTGTNALCPFHGVPLPEVPQRGAVLERPQIQAVCECGVPIGSHPPRCDFVDET